MDVTPRAADDDAAGDDPTGVGGDAGVDLTPRSARRPGSRRRALVVGVALALVMGGIGFVLIKAVGDASLYYYNADEAVAARDDLGDEQFRIQGTYTGGPTEVGADRVRFDIAFGGETVTVDHTGVVPALFEPGTPVVCSGRWSEDGSVFLSDQIQVKHSETYEAENPERIEGDAP